MTSNILVIGKNSQLGRSLYKVLENLGNSSKDQKKFFFASRDQLDLSNTNLIKNFFKENQFNCIINCAAYTSVDKAESDVEMANQINHIAVAQLAEIAKIQRIPLIQISTDHVFEGLVNKPYSEEDNTNPQNIYGKTKLKGEMAIINSGCIGAIIRTSWLHSEFGNNFVKKMLNLSKSQKAIEVVIDQFGSPTYAINLAKVLIAIIDKYKTFEYLNSKLNIFHFTDDGSCSWFEFAKTIFYLSGINCVVDPIKTKDYSTVAIRPNYSVLDKSKIKNYLPDFKMQHWREGLINCLKEIKKQDHLFS